jgi:hypothetical protein
MPSQNKVKTIMVENWRIVEAGIGKQQLQTLVLD